MRKIIITESKDERIDRTITYLVGYCEDRMCYIYQSGFYCNCNNAWCDLRDKIVGYLLDNDISKVGVEIDEKTFGALVSLYNKGLHQEMFALVEFIYESLKK